MTDIEFLARKLAGARAAHIKARDAEMAARAAERNAAHAVADAQDELDAFVEEQVRGALAPGG